MDGYALPPPTSAPPARHAPNLAVVALGAGKGADRPVGPGEAAR
jgi:hypothetical protein